MFVRVVSDGPEEYRWGWDEAAEFSPMVGDRMDLRCGLKTGEQDDLSVAAVVTERCWVLGYGRDRELRVTVSLDCQLEDDCEPDSPEWPAGRKH